MTDSPFVRVQHEAELSRNRQLTVRCPHAGYVARIWRNGRRESCRTVRMSRKETFPSFCVGI